MKLNDLLIRKVFYDIVNDAQVGFTLNISKDELSYVRFNYMENKKLYGNNSFEEVLNKIDFKNTNSKRW